MGPALFCKLKNISVDLSVVEKLLNLKKLDLKFNLANGKKLTTNGKTKAFDKLVISVLLKPIIVFIVHKPLLAFIVKLVV